MDTETKENFFEKYGLEVSTGEVEVGGTYPIYGMITKVLNEFDGKVEATMSIQDSTKINVLKERAFEPGIFVATVTSKDGGVKVDCGTVVFGKRQEFNA